MSVRNHQLTLGLVVALIGYLVVAFAYDFSPPMLDSAPAIKLWVNGFAGLGCIIVGTVITVAGRRPDS